MPRAVALFSGGLDSTLAVRVLQEQGIEVEALNVHTVFECCKTVAAKAAAELGVRLTVVTVADDYLELIRKPKYGYGKGVNPCIDCRAYMARMARQRMEQTGACAVVSGEVLGQRPMSQRGWQVRAIERDSGLEGRLLRPLSAKLLPPTIPEREGLIDRERLYGFRGRGRKELIALAERLGIEEIPQPSTGCPLTRTTFAPRVRDLMQFQPDAARWDFELLNVARHLRLDPHTKVAVGRNQEENAILGNFFERSDAPAPALLHPENFLGPDVLIVGRVTEDAIALGASLVLRFTRRFDPDDALVRVSRRGASRIIRAQESAAAQAAPLL